MWQINYFCKNYYDCNIKNVDQTIECNMFKFHGDQSLKMIFDKSSRALLPSQILATADKIKSLKQLFILKNHLKMRATSRLFPFIDSSFYFPCVRSTVPIVICNFIVNFALGY